MTWQEIANVRVVGIPKGQPRARAFAMRIGGGKFSARMYDPGTAEAWKSCVAGAVGPSSPPIEGHVLLSIDFLFPRPKRLLGKKQPAGRILCDAKPDIDNATKAVMDCLTQTGFWRDDKQVHLGPCLKWYAAKDEQAGAEIRISVLEGGDAAANNEALTSAAPIFVSTNPPTALGCAVSTTHFQRGRVCVDGKGATP